MQTRESVDVDKHDFVIQNQASVNRDEWVRQIVLRRASFEYDHRLKYALDARPCFVDGRASLIVAPDLEIRDPFAFAYIQRFAEENALTVILDRRTAQTNVAIERRAA